MSVLNVGDNDNNKWLMIFEMNTFKKKMHVTDRSVCTMKYAFFLFLFHFYYVMAIILIDQKFS